MAEIQVESQATISRWFRTVLGDFELYYRH